MTMDWYPWYPQDFERDTMHLSLAEDGAYRRLIDRYMQCGPLPDNDMVLARMLGIARDEWSAVAPAVRAFFKVVDGLLHHKRCDIELEDQAQRDKSMRKQRRGAAKARWEHKKSGHPDRIAARNAEVMRDESGDDTGRNAEPMRPNATLHYTTLQDKEAAAAAPETEVPPPKPAPASEPGLLLIEVFDEEIVKTWGANLRRGWPHQTDLITARTMAAEGVDVVMLRNVCQANFARRKAKGDGPPKQLAYLLDAARDAMRAPPAPNKALASPTPATDAEPWIRDWMQPEDIQRKRNQLARESTDADRARLIATWASVEAKALAKLKSKPEQDTAA